MGDYGWGDPDCSMELQCSGNGYEMYGHCVCYAGWSGADCSMYVQSDSCHCPGEGSCTAAGGHWQPPSGSCSGTEALVEEPCVSAGCHYDAHSGGYGGTSGSCYCDSAANCS